MRWGRTRCAASGKLSIVATVARRAQVAAVDVSEWQITPKNKDRRRNGGCCRSNYGLETGCCLYSHKTVLSTQRHQQYPQSPSWFFILERYKLCGDGLLWHWENRKKNREVIKGTKAKSKCWRTGYENTLIKVVRAGNTLPCLHNTCPCMRARKASKAQVRFLLNTH